MSWRAGAMAICLAVLLAPPAQGAVVLERREVTKYDDYFDDLVAADLNGDGRPDLAASDSRGRVRVLLNQGGGTLVRGGTHPVPASLDRLVAADVDRDGDQDLVVAAEGKGAAVLAGDGRGG
ncbi:MAG: VCBS repeat-containing protein, partial [Actinomycetota bacterium]|nr:VCBS repeat-containing protein [Actinomycetota bacterium]